MRFRIARMRCHGISLCSLSDLIRDQGRRFANNDEIHFHSADGSVIFAECLKVHTAGELLDLLIASKISLIRSFQSLGDTDGFPHDALAQARLQAFRRTQVHRAIQQLFKIILQGKKPEITDRFIELYQQVNIACWRCLASLATEPNSNSD